MLTTTPCSHRITIITGHYGTGKTEFAVNLAIAMARDGAGMVTLADLDIVNPYFRSRERKRELEEYGIQVITTSKACSDADVPSIPAEINSIFENSETRAVLDIGGDPAGARVLARFYPQLSGCDCQLVYVVNANRPEVNTAAKALKNLKGIEDITHLKCTALVNNTHLCGETCAETVKKGIALSKELSDLCGAKLICSTAVADIAESFMESEDVFFPIVIKMRKPWELPS